MKKIRVLVIALQKTDHFCEIICHLASYSPISLMGWSKLEGWKLELALVLVLAPYQNIHPLWCVTINSLVYDLALPLKLQKDLDASCMYVHLHIWYILLQPELRKCC